MQGSKLPCPHFLSHKYGRGKEAGGRVTQRQAALMTLNQVLALRGALYRYVYYQERGALHSSILQLSKWRHGETQ